MPKYYVDPQGRRTKTLPRFVVTKSKKSISLPRSITDSDWIKIPGCTIVETPEVDTRALYIHDEVERLVNAYPYVSDTQPGIIVDVQTLLGSVAQAIQAGAPLPTDRVPTWRELYNARDFFTAEQASAMQTLYNGIAIQCGGEEKTFMLLKAIAEYQP
jgi:hypothetical protein